MNKINGYTQEEATGLIEYIYTGRNAGKTLSYLFETYGKEHSRAKGSVRNYYYAFLKRQDDSRVREILNGKDLHANAIRPFTEEETDAMLDKVLAERSKGLSVRRAIMNVSGGDEKLLKKQPERVAQAAKAAGLPEEKTFLQRKLEREIDALYARLAVDLRKENARLREELENLRREKGE